MTPPFCYPNLVKISILLTLILSGFVSIQRVKTMKVHPVPMKRNITTRYDIDSLTSGTTSDTLMDGSAQKKLRRLPHVFSKVLELPFTSDADVTIQESSDCFRFIAEIDDAIGDGVRAHAVEIHPGVTKIVVRGGGEKNNGDEVELLLDKLEIDAWRFRLPRSTRPELATAAFVDGELIVTVPKSGGEFEDEEVWGSWGRLVLVQ
uniref:SHSP domain-containing protein n=1 Tax=Davidia involucrata TaxID=16924 RepID=A0A5B6ZGK0_DAVIN